MLILTKHDIHYWCEGLTKKIYNINSLTLKKANILALLTASV
jgi:hypothetical protein